MKRKLYEVHFRTSVEVYATDVVGAVQAAIDYIEKKYGSVEDFVSEIADPEDLTDET